MKTASNHLLATLLGRQTFFFSLLGVSSSPSMNTHNCMKKELHFKVCDKNHNQGGKCQEKSSSFVKSNQSREEKHENLLILSPYFFLFLSYNIIGDKVFCDSELIKTTSVDKRELQLVREATVLSEKPGSLSL